MRWKLYTAYIAGDSWNGGKKYKKVIITKWKDATEDSPEEGHKAYYLTPNLNYLEKHIHNESWCKKIYENYPANSKVITVEKESII